MKVTLGMSLIWGVWSSDGAVDVLRSSTGAAQLGAGHRFASQGAGV